MSGRTRLALCSYAATLLTAGALLPLVDEAGWLLQVAVLLGLQNGAGALARRVPLARPLTLALQLLVSLLTLTVLFVRESAVAWLIPGPEAIAHFGQLFAAGYDDVSRYAIPAPATDGIRLMLIGGVLAIGLAVDALAVTYRAAAPAGLPLLALYTVAAGLSDGGAAWLWFLLAAAGYLLLLLAEGRDRLSRWGRVFGGAPPAARRGGALDGGGAAHAPVRTGRRIGVVALGVALAVPAALPALDGGLLDGTGSGPGRGSGGGGTISAVSPLVSLQENLNQPQNREVLRYRTNAPDPRSLYLRIVALDRFDGTAWRSSQRKVEDVPERLPEPSGLSPAVDVTEVRTNLSAAGTYKQTWLPMPYPATKVGIEGRWRFEPEGRTLVGDRQTTAGVQYSVSSLVVQPTREQLADAPAPNSELKREYTQVPGSLPAEVAATAQRITKGAANDFARASKLQQWFAEDGGFTYSTRVRSGTGVAAIGRFLEEKRGFCVHFSFSMAAMARTLGIPARVAVGFTPGTPQSDGTVSVGLRDAHAWPELYFEGVGWTRFEPTPSRGTVPEYAREETPSADPSAPAQPETGESSEPSSAPAAPDACPEHERRLGECGAAQPQEVAQGAEGGTPWTSVLFTALAAVGVVALLLLPLLWRALTRRRRLRAGSGGAAGPASGPAGAVVTDGPAGAVTVPAEDPAGTLAVWQEITDTAWDLGIVPDESQTPRKAAARIVRLGKLTDEPAAAMHRTARAVEEVLYAPAPRPATGLAEDARRIRSGLRDAADTRTRLRALLLPRSSVRVVWALSDRWATWNTRVSTRVRKPLDRAAALLPRLSRGRG